ncbi:MAG: DUF935 family protein [Flavipsychrobacter sp.]
MSNKKTRITKKAAPEQPIQIVSQSITIRSTDRSPKDIGSLQTGLVNAERVHQPSRVKLYDTYEDIMRDAHLSGIIHKRFSAVLNKKLTYRDKKGVEIEGMETLIKSAKFKRMMRCILFAKAWGFTLFEFLPGREFNFMVTPRKHVKPELGIIADEQTGITGTQYEGVWNFWFVGEKQDLGFLLKCAPYAIYKKGAIADWAQYVEIFGMPVRVIKYDANDQQISDEIDDALENSGSALVLKIPKQADFDIMDGKQSNGTGDLQNTLRNAMNEEMSVLVLGNTETTTSSKSSGYAQSKEHARQQLEITKDDMADLCDALNDPQFIAILKSYGLPVVEGGVFSFEREYNASEVIDQLSIIEKVKALGEPVESDYIYEVSGVPKPKEYEALKAEMKAQQPTIKNKPAPTKQDPQEDPEDIDEAVIEDSLRQKIGHYIVNKLAAVFRLARQ